jgi:hypothetical protein
VCHTIKDGTRLETDSDISDLRLSIFQFPSPRIEADRIHMETDSDISDIHFPIFFPFPSLHTTSIHIYYLPPVCTLDIQSRVNHYLIYSIIATFHAEPEITSG